MFTLLVADSSREIANAIYEFCKSYEYIDALPSVQNGQEALQIIAQQHVDVLLMDIVLPVLDGLSVLAHINAMPEQYRRPAVFVHTAFLDNVLMHELQRLQVLYCFVKPMEPEYIIPRIIQLVRASGDLLADDKSILHRQDGQKGDLNTEITRQIRAVGIPAHLRGYHYLRAAIQYSVEAKDPSAIAVTKDIYPLIAVQYNTRPSLVERSIRNAIEVAWTRGDVKILNQYFGYTIDDHKGKPTNAEFIAMIADRVRMIM